MYHQPGLLIKAYNILNLDSQVSQGDMPPQQTLSCCLLSCWFALVQAASLDIDKSSLRLPPTLLSYHQANRQ